MLWDRSQQGEDEFSMQDQLFRAICAIVYDGGNFHTAHFDVIVWMSFSLRTRKSLLCR